MNEFNTTLIELLEKMCEYIPANKADERVVVLFKELHELNEQEIEQDNSTPLKDLDFSIIQVNELKPTMSKIKSVDNYLCKWQKLKEFIIKKQEEYQADIIEQGMQGSIPNSISFYARYNLCNEIQKKIQELEGEDVKG